MHTKKIILAVFLSFCISNLAASEVDSPSISNNANEQRDASNNSATQETETASSSSDGNKTSSQTAEADKKPSMADYCRKHTC